MHYVIDRSKWKSGEGGDYETGSTLSTSLLDYKGAMCCLGHCLKQHGFREDELFEKGEPEQLEDRVDKAVPFVTLDSTDGECENSMLTNEAISINDDEKTTPAEKEELLIELFKKYNHTIEFTGEIVMV